MTRAVTLVVDGEEQTIDLDEVMVIVDPEEDRRTVAADIAWWGELWARAVEAAEIADAEYRQWSGKSTAAGADSGEGDKKGLPEWKVKAVVEGSPQFLTLKKRIAEANGNVTRTKAVFEAYCHKAELLRGKTQQESREAFHANALGRGRPDADATEDPRAKKMAANNQQKRK